MRRREDSLIKIRRKLGISRPKTKKLEGYRLLNSEWKRKDIAKELGVDFSTISKWKVLQQELNNAQLPYHKEKKQHCNFESGYGESSSEGKNQENQGHSKPKIDYNFSQETLDCVRRESEEWP